MPRLRLKLWSCMHLPSFDCVVGVRADKRIDTKTTPPTSTLTTAVNATAPRLQRMAKRRIAATPATKYAKPMPAYRGPSAAVRTSSNAYASTTPSDSMPNGKRDAASRAGSASTKSWATSTLRQARATATGICMCMIWRTISRMKQVTASRIIYTTYASDPRSRIPRLRR